MPPYRLREDAIGETPDGEQLERIRLWDSPCTLTERDSRTLRTGHRYAGCLTSNFDVSFFATCAWNSSSAQIWSRSLTISLLASSTEFTPYSLLLQHGANLMNVRPSVYRRLAAASPDLSNSAFCRKMKPGQIPIHCLPSRHFVSCTRRTSRTVFGMLSTGAALFPDAAAELRRAESLSEFTESVEGVRGRRLANGPPKLIVHRQPVESRRPPGITDGRNATTELEQVSY